MNQNYSLFIDTCQNECNLAICDKSNKVIISHSEFTHNNMTDVVVEKIDDLFKKAKINKNQIDQVFVTNGPGSFTGARVGVLVAKT